MRYDKETFIKQINFLNKSGILYFCTSTGLIPTVTTLQKFKDIVNDVPTIMEVKVIAKIELLKNAEDFINSGADLISTRNILFSQK
jgi:deoxyribose-phosphate aldolase